MPKPLEEVANAPHIIPACGKVPELKLAPTLAKADYADLRQRVKGERLKALRGSGLPIADPTYQAGLAVALKAPLSQEEFDEYFGQEEGVRFFLWLHMKRAGMSVDWATTLAWDIEPPMQAEINAFLFPAPPEEAKAPLAVSGEPQSPSTS